MKAFLMHPERDFDLEAELPPNAEDLTQDLELERTLAAMASGDEFLLEVARRAVLLSLTDADAIEYRQDVLRDCLDHPEVVRALYDLALETIQRERRDYFSLVSTSPDSILHRSLGVLEMFAEVFKRLRGIADEHADAFRSRGFTRLFTTLQRELDDDYLASVEDHLRELRFRHGVLISAQLGKGNKGTGFVLRRTRDRSWLQRLAPLDRSSLTYRVPDRDQAGADALYELRGRGVNLVANALAQSNEHILSFFKMLRAELAFYIGALNLHERLTAKGEPVCMPVAAEGAFSSRGLYDVSLALGSEERVVGNDVDADGRSLVVITGANHGGKSTFLRSAGLAQLMFQAGLFVGAEAFTADVRHGVFTHFKREEDATMRSGKLDEELRRMSDIVDGIGRRGLLLCNESFASTNEREGSEIARQLIRALREAGVKVFFVTHMYDLAHGLYTSAADDTLFLRAPRQEDGTRSYRLAEGEPLPTSYGEDLYVKVFGEHPQREPAAR
jgi:DNA mismatch repair ATPase MutS